MHGLPLGWQTELIFPRFDAEVERRHGHWVVRTSQNPTFHWGNFLLFDHAPRAGDAERWIAAFDDEIAGLQPESRHLAFGIADATPFALPVDFATAGLVCEHSTTLALTPARPRPRLRPLAASCAVEMLELAVDQAAAVELQVAADEGDYEPQAHRLFRERQMARYAAMEHAGLGRWFAVREGGRLVADCGLFRDPARPVGRFQHVSTHPAHRRRGLCTALVDAVVRHGFEQMHLETLVIAADPDDVAIRIYEAAGFERQGVMWRLHCRDRDRAMAAP